MVANTLAEMDQFKAALNNHMCCVIENHETDGGYNIEGIGLVCPQHWEVLQNFFHKREMEKNEKVV